MPTFASTSMAVSLNESPAEQPVTQKDGPAELAEQGRGELLERVGQDDDLHERAKFIEKFPAAGQRPQRADDLLDVGKFQAVPVENGEPPQHELVIIRLVARGA